MSVTISMPTPKYFSKIPEFPSNIKVIDIPTISFENLKKAIEQDSDNLFEASREYGFFLLDLRNSEEGERLLKDTEKMFDLTAATFDLGPEILEEKYAYNPPKSLLGYKSTGKLPTDDGKKDAIEIYTLGQDDILGTIPPRQNPEVVEAHRKDCQDFFRRAYSAVCVILSALDKQLALPLGTLASLCPLDKPSATSLRMLLTGAQPIDENHRIALPGHTEIGAITLLFNVAGGLQILPTSSENVSPNWRYIRPKPGCALINIGDTLVEWTGGVLRSSLHRVVTAPGKQAGVARQSLAYLARPDYNGSMRRLRSKAIPPVAESEVDETRSVNDWAAWRALQVMKGELKAQTRGGRPVQINNAVKVN